MKRLTLGFTALVTLVACVFIASPRLLNAGDFQVAVSTISPMNGAGEFTASGSPQLAGAKAIKEILLSNGNGVEQTVTMYKTCTTTVLCSTAATFVIPSTTTFSFIPAADWSVSNMSFSKSNAGSPVRVTVIYR